MNVPRTIPAFFKVFILTLRSLPFPVLLRLKLKRRVNIQPHGFRFHAERLFSPDDFRLAIRIFFIGIFFALNFWRVKVFTKSNAIITLFKFIVPVVTIIVLLTQLKSRNFSIHGFPPFGFSGVETAISVLGRTGQCRLSRACPELCDCSCVGAAFRRNAAGLKQPFY